jgi:CRISPR-associated protein Csm4
MRRLVVAELKSYRITLRLKSPMGTPWQADTIIGHLAWIERFKNGERGIKEFLSPFLEGKPPFVLSDGFPEDLLPRPYGMKQAAAIQDLDSYSRERRARKAEFLKASDFGAICLGQEIKGHPVPSPWEEFETLHATISRKSNTTSDEAGNLFSTESWCINREFAPNAFQAINIYLYCQETWRARIEDLFRDLSSVGFGRDKSVGLGQFEILKMDEWEGFKKFKGANAFIALSSFVPQENDPIEGRWAFNIKYGKLGETAPSGNPFKRPFLQMKPGAVFFTGGSPKPFYGRVLSNLSPSFPEAIQICYCLAVPSIWQEG